MESLGGKHGQIKESIECHSLCPCLEAGGGIGAYLWGQSKMRRRRRPLYPLPTIPSTTHAPQPPPPSAKSTSVAESTTDHSPIDKPLATW
jgi:hypothetical protein